MFGAVKSTKNTDIENCKYSEYGIGFDKRGTFSFPTGGFGCNVIISVVVTSSFIHADNKKTKVLILSEGPTQGLDGTTLTAEKNIKLILL